MSISKGMTDYEMDLVRHIVGKALVESDEIDVEELPSEDLRTALWAASGEISYGGYTAHPDKRDMYKYHPAADGETDKPTGG